MAKFFSSTPPLSRTILIGLTVCALATTTLADDRDERSYDIGNFTEIYLKGPYEVVLVQSNTCSLHIEAPEGTFEDIGVEVKGDKLCIEWQGSKIKSSKNIDIRIGVQHLARLEILGAVNLKNEDVLHVENLKLEFEGAGNLELDLEAQKIISEITGVGNFVLRGSTEYHKVEFSGVGKYDARELLSQYTYVESTGVGSVKVHAARKFIGEASGVGSVDYYGNPAETTIDATGIGSIDRH